MQETRVQSLGWEDPQEEDMAPHSRILAWRIPRTEEPGWLQSMRLHRVRQDCSNYPGAAAYTHTHTHTHTHFCIWIQIKIHITSLVSAYLSNFFSFYFIIALFSLVKSIFYVSCCFLWRVFKAFFP